MCAREPDRVRSPLQGTDTDGLPSPKTTNLVVAIFGWSLRKLPYMVQDMKLTQIGVARVNFILPCFFVAWNLRSLIFCPHDLMPYRFKGTLRDLLSCMLNGLVYGTCAQSNTYDFY